MYRLMHKISDNYAKIVRCEQVNMEDAEVAILCYGGTMRAAVTAMEEARAKGIRCGIFRPITIWPFPERELKAALPGLKKIVVAEHNYGQLVMEVERLVQGHCPVAFVGKYNGTVLTPQDILQKVEEAQ